jgi:hypothetical protein
MECIYLDKEKWCVCNPNLPSLYRLLLHFSYVYTTCDTCHTVKYKYKHRRYIYENEDLQDHTYSGELENEDLEDIILQIKNSIKQNPKVLFIKVMDLTPLELITRLNTILEEEHNDPFLKYMYHCQIRMNQCDLDHIQKFAKFEYLKYELVTTVAYRYIQNSNHIGNNGKLFQLPYELWEHIFTFI